MSKENEKTVILEISRFVADALGELGEILTDSARELHAIVEQTLVDSEEAEMTDDESTQEADKTLTESR